MDNFYVYAYLREDLTPYYIGKGNLGKLKPCSEKRRNTLKEIKKEQRYNYNKTVYTFKNKDLSIFKGTVIEFCDTYNLFKSNVYKLVYKQSKTVKGWKII